MISPQKGHSGLNDPYDIPLYYSAEVARLVDITTYRVHRWLEGYKYLYETKIIKKPPVVKKRGNNYLRPNYASFYDLIDLLLVKRFLDYGLSLQKIRKAFYEAEQILNTSHFAHQKFFTDGKNICLQIKDKGKGRGETILELLSDGQWVISDLVKQLAHQIIFDDITKEARRWFPEEGDNLVVLDPRISFGKPIIEKKGITTENIYNFYIGEGSREVPTVRWFNLDSREIRAAVKFEEYLAA
ncbi:MAG: hypothetical protein WBC70_07635 [Candidatus Aminicenantales bacterium]